MSKKIHVFASFDSYTTHLVQTEIDIALPQQNGGKLQIYYEPHESISVTNTQTRLHDCRGYCHASPIKLVHKPFQPSHWSRCYCTSTGEYAFHSVYSIYTQTYYMKKLYSNNFASPTTRREWTTQENSPTLTINHAIIYEWKRNLASTRPGRCGHNWVTEYVWN
jgi:hypothetical protein